MRAAKTIARAGDDCDASVKPDCHTKDSRIWFLPSYAGLTRVSITLHKTAFF
jgi:hypothetical protein